MFITASINLDKIDNSKIVEGKKGRYVNIIINTRDEQDDYGNNGYIAQSVSKEERDNGVKGAILGNIKIYSNNGGGKPSPKKQSSSSFEEDPSDLPF